MTTAEPVLGFDTLLCFTPCSCLASSTMALQLACSISWPKLMCSNNSQATCLHFYFPAAFVIIPSTCLASYIDHSCYWPLPSTRYGNSSHVEFDTISSTIIGMQQHPNHPHKHKAWKPPFAPLSHCVWIVVPKCLNVFYALARGQESQSFAIGIPTFDAVHSGRSRHRHHGLHCHIWSWAAWPWLR